MNLRSHRVAHQLIVIALGIAACGTSLGDPIQVPGSTPNAKRLVEGERLSQWLLSHEATADEFLAGMSWEVDSERKAQAAEHLALLLYMANTPIANRQNKAGNQQLLHFIESLPVTGRVPLPSADARYLQYHPEADPLLAEGDRVVIPTRPHHVVVLTAEGDLCTLPYRASLFAADYLKACPATRGARIEQVYIGEPNAIVRRAPVAAWNKAPQVEPGPGAWIFAPSVTSGWDDALATRLTKFLVTQGPVPDTLNASSDTLAVNTIEASSSAPPHSVPVTSSDWGVVGLLQTPTARMRDEGSFSLTYSRVQPYSRVNFIFQPLDWLEAGFRYSALSNELYGVIPGSKQAYLDKSVDLKVRLLEESGKVPAVAVGLRDIGGTGLFSGEYLVANKRYGDIDASLGLGWGNVGARGDVSNPLSIFGSSFNTRGTDPSSGQLDFRSYFHGRTSPFGGVTWQTPYDPLSIKIEYDGNNYKHEPFNTTLPVSSPINMGAVYRYSPNLDITVGVERGNTAAVNLSFHTDLSRLGVPKFADPAPVAIAATRPYYVDAGAMQQVAPAPGAPSSAAILPGRAVNSVPAQKAVAQSDPARAAVLAPSPVNWARTARDIATQTGWRVAEIRPDGRDLRVVFANPDAVYWRGLVDRAVAVLHRDAPSTFDRFRLVFSVRGVAMTEYLVYRDYWVEERTSLQAPQDMRQALLVMQPHQPGSDAPAYKSDEAILTGGIGPSYQQTVGGPNSYILYQIGVGASGELHIDPHTWIYSGLNYRLIDNFSDFTYDAPSNLPRVRTDIREYVERSRLTMPNLQLTNMNQLGTDQFYELYAGYLESMFAGVGGEYLYRPLGSPLSLGFDVNEVKQRGFRQDFDLMPYHTFTGFGTVYWETGWNQILAKLSVGQYLAGDRGATLDLSRMFNNGVVVGAYATKTNISAATYGEGSFDKGIYVTVPFDALLGRSSGYEAPLRWIPVLRDGGQMLNRAYPLYDQTNLRDPRTLDFGPPAATSSSTAAQ